jgi:hypothetical protein
MASVSNRRITHDAQTMMAVNLKVQRRALWLALVRNSAFHRDYTHKSYRRRGAMHVSESKLIGKVVTCRAAES